MELRYTDGMARRPGKLNNPAAYQLVPTTLLHLLDAATSNGIK